MGLFGGGKSSTVNTSTQRISSFQVNQSSYGCPIKLIFGTAMVSGVLLDYVDFKAIAHVTETHTGGGKGGGGGGTTQRSTEYTYTVAGVVALGEGPLAGVGKIWCGSKTTSLYGLNLTFFKGSQGQSPWGYMSSKHADHALGYSRTAYLAGVVDLGSSASLPNMNFEVYGLCQKTSPTNYSKASTTVSNTCLTTQVRGQDENYTYYYTVYKVDKTFTINNASSVVSVSCSPPLKGGRTSAKWVILPDNCKLKWSATKSGNDLSVHVWSIGGYRVIGGSDGYQWNNVTKLTVTFKRPQTGTVGTPTKNKMQQFAYTKEIEISNFESNRYVQEYVFNPVTGSGSWVTLNTRYYTVEQAEDSSGNAIADTYRYTFNFDDRDDGYHRPDPTYVRIYYTALQATVNYAPTDANPRDIIYTLLTSTVYGENFPSVLIDEESLASYKKYCAQNSLLISPVYDDQTSCTDIIDSLMECTNSAYVFSQGKVKIIPYWDGLPANYAITDKHIIDQGEETLLISRTSQADTYNIIPLEHTSRANQYTSNVVYATDEGDIELHGVRQAGTYSHPEIMNQSLAQAVAQLILQKQLYNRNKYTVKLGQEFILLEPMDAVTLESQLGHLGVTSVRVIEIVESEEDFTLEITFEDNITGITEAPEIEEEEVVERAQVDTAAEPGNTNRLVIFEAPTALVESATGYELWLFASGEDEWWGGCNIWVSLDDESYQLIGSILNPARQGYLTAALPSDNDHIDETNTLSVDLSESRGELVSVSQQDVNSLASLAWIQNDENGEFIAYRDAELTAQYNYDVSYMYRGLYGSTASAHEVDSKFVRVDTSVVLKYPFQTKDVGKTIYIKATSFNAFGTSEQDLAEVEGMEFTIVGYNKKTILVSGTATIQKDTPTTISYSQTFTTAPYPQVTITDAQTGDLLKITNTTTTGFDCYYENDDAEILETTRTINYMASGQ